MTIEELDTIIAASEAELLQLKGVRDLMASMVMTHEKKLETMRAERERLLLESKPAPQPLPAHHSQVINNFYGNTGQVLNDVNPKSTQ